MSQLFGIFCESLPLVTLLTLLVLVAVPRRMPATRLHQMLVIAAILSLTAPLLQKVTPEWQVLPRPARHSPVIAAVMPSSSREVSAQVAPSAGAPVTSPAVGREDSTQVAGSWSIWFRVAALVWLLGAVVGLLRLLIQHAALSRCLRSSTAAPVAIGELAMELLQRPVKVRLAVDTGDAFVCRVFSPVIVLPAAAVHLPPDQLRLILSHEVAHLRRFDPLWAWLMQCFLAIYWVHPLAWLLVKRSHLAREMATDDLVLLGGSDPEAYAACLGASALRHRRHAAPPLPALAFVRQHPVLARLHAILDANRARTEPTGRGWLSAGLPLAAPALLLTSLAFKAAVEVQPVRQAQKKLAANTGATLSLWSDLVEPLVSDAPPEPLHADASPGAQSHAINGEASHLSPIHSTAGSNSAIAATPSGERDLEYVAFREDTGAVVYTESRGAPPHAFGVGHPGRPGKRQVSPTTPPTDAIANPGDSTSTPPDRTKPPVEVPSVPSVTPSDGTTIPGSNPSTPTDVVEAIPQPPDDGSSDPGSEEEEPVREPTFHPPDRIIEGSPIDGSEEINPPQPQISTYASSEGSHFAITWIVSVDEAGNWIPQASADLVTWSAHPDAVMVEGPIPAGDGAVRFTAAIREPMPGSFYKFLRLATPAANARASAEATVEE